MQRYLMSVATSSLALAYAGCVASDDATSSNDEPVQVASTQQAVTAIGDPLPGTDPDAFEEAKANFAAVEEIEDGLGPVFNEKACAACHGIPTIGGSGNQIERRYGSITDGVFFAYDRGPEDNGGTLRPAVLQRHVRQPGQRQDLHDPGRARARGRQHPQRRPPRAAAVRSRPRRCDARWLLRPAGRARARLDPRHGAAPPVGLPGLARSRPGDRPPARALGIRTSRPTSCRSQATYIADGHLDPELLPGPIDPRVRQ